MADWLNITFASFDNTLLTYFHTLAEKYGNVLTPISKVLGVTCDLPLLMIGWFGFLLFFVMKDKKCSMMMCGSIIIGAFLTTIIIKNNSKLLRKKAYFFQIGKILENQIFLRI